MTKRINKFFKISDENILLIVLALMSFSIGIWANYRQLWLQSNNFSLSQISKILSVALICSGVIAFIISLFSSKVKIKNIILEAIVIRCFALMTLLLNVNEFTIKTCILLSIMCEVIFSISYYPLLSIKNKSNALFNRKNLIDYIAKDTGIISCGLLVGISVGKIIFDYNSCLFLSLISCLLSGLFLVLYKQPKLNKKENTNLKESFIKILKSKTNIVFLIEQVFVNISYGIVFDLLLLILTSYIKLEVSFASIFIIVSNIFGSISCTYFNKITNKISVNTANIIKFGSRFLGYLVAALTNNIYIYLLSIFIAHVTSRTLEDKVLAVFINNVDGNSKFLYENIRYFIASIGEGIGAFLAGIFLAKSLKMLFMAAAIFTLLQMIVLYYTEKLRIRNE